MIQPRSEESLASRAQEYKLKNEISIASLSSAPSTDLAKSQRPKGLSLENRSEVMIPHKQRSLDSPRGIDADEFFDEQHSKNDHYRDSFASSGAKIPMQHMSNYTDDSMEEPYLDKVTAANNWDHTWAPILNISILLQASNRLLPHYASHRYWTYETEAHHA